MTEPLTFAPLWKYMNTTPLPRTAGVVNAPKTASSSLIRQATRGLLKGQDRKGIMRELATSTARNPAVVARPPPAAPAAAPPPASPSSGGSLPGPASGFGGAGYSGNNAALLGHASNPGFTTAPPPPPPHP